MQRRPIVHEISECLSMRNFRLEPQLAEATAFRVTRTTRLAANVATRLGRGAAFMPQATATNGEAPREPPSPSCRAERVHARPHRGARACPRNRQTARTGCGPIGL